MKIAVLVYGMYREFDIAFKSWDFIDKFNCDVYISTWSKSKQINNRLGIFIDETVDEQRILNKIPNAIISIKDDTFQNLTNHEKIIFHWKTALQLIVNSNIYYDFLIITRPDNYINFNVTLDELKKLSNTDKIYGLEPIRTVNDSLFLQDIFFIGNFLLIKKLIDNLPQKLDLSEFNGEIHHHLAKHVLLNNLDVDVIDNVNAITVRANCRNLSNDEMNINNIYKKLLEWGENQEQYRVN